jgi:methylated-DNA-[protein]-cysteine S-methyltransferase
MLEVWLEMLTNILMPMSYKLMNSPVCTLKLVASDKGLVAVLWENDNPRRVRLGDVVEEPLHPVLVRTENELKEYFAGKRHTFSVPLDMRGTPFQKEVWEVLLGIPFGETCTYGNIAKRLGNPAASRAVGGANRRNPISIIVPCHRVVGAAGNLTGFAGGLEAKTYLLSLEATNDEKSESR